VTWSAGPSTQRDPIGLAGGFNQYGYAGGDPVNYSDPFGLASDAKADEQPAEPAVDPGSCFLNGVASNMRETEQGIRDAVGVSGESVVSAAKFLGGLAGRGLAGSGLETSGSGRLMLQWALGRSAGAEGVGAVFGFAKVQGIRVGVTSGGAALSGTALGIGVATNLAAGAAVGAAFQAGTVIGSGMAAAKCARAK